MVCSFFNTWKMAAILLPQIGAILPFTVSKDKKEVQSIYNLFFYYSIRCVIIL